MVVFPCLVQPLYSPSAPQSRSGLIQGYCFSTFASSSGVNGSVTSKSCRAQELVTVKEEWAGADKFDNMGVAIDRRKKGRERERERERERDRMRWTNRKDAKLKGPLLISSPIPPASTPEQQQKCPLPPLKYPDLPLDRATEAWH